MCIKAVGTDNGRSVNDTHGHRAIPAISGLLFAPLTGRILAFRNWSNTGRLVHQACDTGGNGAITMICVQGNLGKATKASEGWEAQ